MSSLSRQFHRSTDKRSALWLLCLLIRGARRLALRWIRKDGSAAWAPTVELARSERLQALLIHLAGRERRLLCQQIRDGRTWRAQSCTIGAYAIHRDEYGQHWAYWGCVDVDGAGHADGLEKKRVRKLMRAIVRIMAKAGLHPFVEISHSGKGFHVWCIFKNKMSGAYIVWLAALIAKTAAKRAGIDKSPESFPKSANGTGGLVALPFPGAPRGDRGGEIVWSRTLKPRNLSTIKLVSDVAALAYLPQYRKYLKRTKHERAERSRSHGDSDDVTCAEVARILVPERITSEDEDRLRLDCPRHDSRSAESLHVTFARDGWHCWACGVGGKSYKLAKWLSPDGASPRDIFNTLDRVRLLSIGIE